MVVFSPPAPSFQDDLQGSATVAEASSTGPLHFVSMGMVVLDELCFPDGETLEDIPGGSGTYATPGARMITGAARSKSVGFVILAGDDFPSDIIHDFRRWDVALAIHDMGDRGSTRALLEYLDTSFGRKTFSYATPPWEVNAKLLEAYGLLSSTAFHILANFEDYCQHMKELLTLRTDKKIPGRPLMVGGPAPPKCTPHYRGAHARACRIVDVFPPNHIELAALYEEGATVDKAFDHTAIEQYAERLLHDSKSDEVKIFVRAGEHGCLILFKAGDVRWLPSYYDPSSTAIVDPTGAGNAFLGAFTASLQKSDRLVEAAIHGSVAASFALEQIGLPLPELREGVETWNSVSVATRLQAYRERLHSSC